MSNNDHSILSLSSILPPSASPGPTKPLDSPLQILGPLPPTAPLHLALDYIASQDRWQSSYGLDRSALRPTAVTTDSNRLGAETVKTTKALVITGNKRQYQYSIEHEDEDWMRSHGGSFAVIQKLKKIDMRYCPSPKHLQLLLSLVSSVESGKTSNGESVVVDSPPGLIILWDIAGLFMADGHLSDQGRQNIFKPGTCISDYLNTLAAARATVDHFSKSCPSAKNSLLVVFEPRLTLDMTLPVQAALSAEGEGDEATNFTRKKSIPLIDGIRWLMGQEAVGVVKHLATEDREGEEVFELTFEVTLEKFHMRRRLCPQTVDGKNDNVRDVPWHRQSWQWEWI
ncbi:uncharacterized protein L203_103465 [Cryptococcus depauperatus CBS 7841]|uniref:Uncharacterized protein n=1 Tax=Cryptococcus depauperatus CBS 7841 TaxID=1295531 RepID=A0AAJ8JTV2_9TREE